MFKLRGHFSIQHFRKGKLLDTYEIDNGIVTVGFNKLLDIMFNAAIQINMWYMGLIDNVGFTGLATTDIMGAHAGWTELITYTQANRPALNTGTLASAQTLVASSVTIFTINSTQNVKGVFIVNDNTKAGTAGLLWCTALLDSVKPVANGDSFKILYTLSVA